MSDRRSGARICLATLRNLDRKIFRCGLYEAEDVLIASADVDVIELERGAHFRWHDWFHRRLVYRDYTGRLALTNPGLRSVRLDQDYDLFVAIVQKDEDLSYLNAIQNWPQRCGTSVCWIDEIWTASIGKSLPWLSVLQKFDHIVIGSTGNSAAALAKTIGKACHSVPLGVDTLRFAPIDDAPRRTIDVCGIGRTPPGIHRALRDNQSGLGLFYLYDTFAVADAQARDPAEHRAMMSNVLKRSRCSIVAPAKFDTPDETHHQIEFGPRYYEGAAAGAVLIGQPADNARFKSLFDWQDVVIPVALDGSDVIAVLDELEREPERVEAISRRNVQHCLLRHDWVDRWRRIFKIAGLDITPGMHRRTLHLQDLAARLEPAGRSGRTPSGPVCNETRR